MQAVLFLKAYERKLEMGGGFRGAVIKDKTRVAESPIFDTLDAAKFWVQNEAHKMMNGIPYRRAYVSKRFTGGSYQARIWI